MFQLHLIHARVRWIDRHVAWCLGRVICMNSQPFICTVGSNNKASRDHFWADHQDGQLLWLRNCPSFSRANSLLGDMGIMLAPPVEGLQHDWLHACSCVRAS